METARLLLSVKNRRRKARSGCPPFSITVGGRLTGRFVDFRTRRPGIDM